MELLTERHADAIAGVVSCYDRVLIQGTLPGLCYTEGMTAYLKARPIRIFDYPRFAQPLRDALRENAERLAAEHGLEIMFLRKKNFRKEDRVKQILEKRGHHPSLVCIFSAMEPCATYPPWHDKQSEKTYLRPMTASACTTTFISSTKSWAWGMFAFPPGAPSVFRSILTAITGWATAEAPYRLYFARPCLHPDRRLEAGAAP